MCFARFAAPPAPVQPAPVAMPTECAAPAALAANGCLDNVLSNNCGVPADLFATLASLDELSLLLADGRNMQPADLFPQALAVAPVPPPAAAAPVDLQTDACYLGLCSLLGDTSPSSSSPSTSASPPDDELFLPHTPFSEDWTELSASPHSLDTGVSKDSSHGGAGKKKAVRRRKRVADMDRDELDKYREKNRVVAKRNRARRKCAFENKLHESDTVAVHNDMLRQERDRLAVLREELKLKALLLLSRN